MAATEQDLRQEVREWVTQHWDPSMSLREWRELLVTSGWAVPSWPERWYGKGLPAWADDVVDTRSRAAMRSLTSPADWPVRPSWSRDLTSYGSGSSARFSPGPSRGASCLASRRPIRPRRAHNHRRPRRRRVVVNGQKVWNTSAHHADLGMLVARTDWDAPKHHGITYFVLPMHQPGVEGAASTADEPPRLVQRGLPDRRTDPQGLGRGRGEPGVDRGPRHPRPRTALGRSHGCRRGRDRPRSGQGRGTR